MILSIILYVTSIPQECSEQPTAGHRQRCQQQDRLGTPTETNQNVLTCLEIQWFIATIEVSSTQSALAFHLSWHDFAIDATDVDAGIQASLVVGVNNVTPE